MSKRIVLLLTLLIGLGVITVGHASADDHLFTAVAAGGLTTNSNPFTKTNGISGLAVPGQGSPLSGADSTVPAVASEDLPSTANPGNGALRTPPPVQDGKIAPSSNSTHP